MLRIIDDIVRIKLAIYIGIPAIVAKPVAVNDTPVKVETPYQILTTLIKSCCF